MKRSRHQKRIRKQAKERREIARVWEKALDQAEANVMDRFMRGVLRLRRLSRMPTLSDSPVCEINRPAYMTTNRFRFSTAMDSRLRPHTPQDYLDMDACTKIGRELLKEGYIVKTTMNDRGMDITTYDIVASKPDVP